jgi:hypothetical protein
VAVQAARAFYKQERESFSCKFLDQVDTYPPPNAIVLEVKRQTSCSPKHSDPLLPPQCVAVYLVCVLVHRGVLTLSMS